MAGRFPLGRTTVVTTRAGTRNRVVINTDGPPTARGRVAIIAGVAARYMGGRFALGCAAVMTTRTASGHCVVIKPGRRPAVRSVAILTGVATGNVGG